MKNYILTKIYADEKGLFLCELPTGYGKTYTISQVMKEYVESKSNRRKIIYLTTMNKNLPEKELLSAFDDEDEYNRNVLRIRSNFDEVTDKLESLIVPEEHQTPLYYKLINLVKKYNKLISEKVRDKEYVKDIENRINECERAFRREITQNLRKRYKNKSTRLEAIRNHENWKWVGKLYPAVFTDEHQILLMSVSKFMKRNATLIEPSYEFLKSDIIENSIIFIDEFDATKATIQSEIIEKSLAVSEEYLGLFKQILRGLNPNYLSKTMSYAYKKIEESDKAQYTFDKVLQEATSIEEKYNIYLSYKTVEENIDQKQNFLLKDATYHTVFHDDKKFIRAVINKDENRVDIFFEDHNEFYSKKNQAKQDIGIFSMLREINRFLLHFRTFVYEWARHYMEITNYNRKPEEDSMIIENAMSTILRRLELTEKQQKLMLGELCNPMVNKDKKELIPDNSFYQQGIEVFELEDSDSHHDNTNLKLVEIYDTPEKILTYLAQKSTVFGISATAEVGSVIGNYDLDYLTDKLENKLHLTPSYIKNKIVEQLEKQWQAYDNGRIQIHTEVIDTHPADARELLTKNFDNELSEICYNYISNTGENEYYIIRYCNMINAMTDFFRLQEIQSFLYLGMSLPKKDNSKFDENLLNDLFNIIREYLFEKDKSKLFILKSDNFDIDKENLINSLAKGERVFVISSYSTIGAGQNLQYKAINKDELIELVPNINNEDKRHQFKDFDAIYLGDITHLTVNTYTDEKISEKDLFEMLFQIEELKQHSEISFTDADSMIKLAFESYKGKSKWTNNILYKTNSVLLQANRHVMQAVGRMCRTFLKRKNIYIFIEKPLLEKMSVSELKKHILPPEMQEIVKLREKLGKEYSNEEEAILKNAEKISSFGMWNIRQTLSQNWDEDSMKLWNELRRIVLTYPTATADLRNKESIVKKLYITSGKEQNEYLYSQNSDFRDVIIDFSNDKIGFRNSGRAKRKSYSDDAIIYEMSEENSGLPIAMKYPELDKHFTEKGYATKFEENEYIMSPVLFHNIYKGALGEVAGSFILKKELGINLIPIADPNRFEFFDFELKKGVYVDFKNWKFTYYQDRETIKKQIIDKMDEIGANRVYIINLIGDEKIHKPTSQINSRIIEIPGLINKQGKVIKQNLRMIREEDFNDIDK